MSIIREFLVALGYKVDSSSEQQFIKSTQQTASAAEDASKRINSAGDSQAKAEAKHAAGHKKTAETTAKEDKQRAKDEQRLLGERIKFWEESGRKIGGAIRTSFLATGAAGLGGLAAYTALIKRSTGSLDQLYFATKRTGSSAQNLGNLRYAFVQLGLEATDADNAVEGLAEKLRTVPGTKSFLQRLGLDPNQDPAKLVEKLPAALAKAYKVYGTQALAGSDILGLPEHVLNVLRKNGVEVDRLIAERNAKIRALGLDPAKAAANANGLMAEWRRLVETVGLVGDKAAGDASGGLTKVLADLNGWITANGDKIATALTNIATAVGDIGKAATEYFKDFKWDDFAKGAGEVKATLVETKDALIAIAAVFGALAAGGMFKSLLGGVAGAGGLAALLGRLIPALALGYGAVKGADAFAEEEKRADAERQKMASEGKDVSAFSPESPAGKAWARFKNWFSNDRVAPVEGDTSADRSSAVGSTADRLRGRPAPTIAGSPAMELGRDTRGFLERIWDKLTGKSPDPSIQNASVSGGENRTLSPGGGIRLGRGGVGGRGDGEQNADPSAGPGHARPGGGVGSAGAAKRADMMAYAMDQLRKEGVPEASLRAAAAHLVGQADMESGLDPNKSHDGGTGYGIYGARLGRRSKMFAWLKAHGYEKNSAEGQMRYMAHEAMNDKTYGATRRALIEARPETFDRDSDTITRNFEAPKINNYRGGAVKKAFRTDPAAPKPTVSTEEVNLDGSRRNGNDGLYGRKPGPGEYIRYGLDGKPVAIEKYQGAIGGLVNSLIPKAAASTLPGAPPPWAGGFDTNTMRDRFSTPPAGTSNDNRRTINNTLTINQDAKFNGGEPGAVKSLMQMQQRTAEDLLRNMQGAAQ